MNRKRLFGSLVSKPLWFTRFWAGSGCGGPAGWCWVVVPVARRVPQGGTKGRPSRLSGNPLWAASGAPKRHRTDVSTCFGNCLVSLGVYWGVSRGAGDPFVCFGAGRVLQELPCWHSVGLRGLSGLLLGLLRLPGFRRRSLGRHQKGSKRKSGPCCLFCYCLSLCLSLGMPGHVSVHLALCRSVALCRFLPLCPACSRNSPT